MTRILFIIPAFKHGGTNKSLFNILSFIGHEFDISIMALSHLGPYKDLFNREAKIIERDSRLGLLFDNFGNIDLKKDSKKQIITKLSNKLYRKLYEILIGEKGREKILNQSVKKIESMNFDTIIAMQEGDVTSFTARIKGKKIAWVRSDYNEYFKIVMKDESAVYEKFKSIICVSEYTRKTFLTKYPQLEERCYGIHNMIDYNKIIRMSSEKIKYNKLFDNTNFNMVSVGRLSKVKQFDLIPNIASKLKKNGLMFNWYIIGDGEEKARINMLIEKYNVEDEVVLLGEINNPYPYIKQSDLVVVTSLSEACPNVINEGKILHVPVITTNFGSAKEFIENGGNGIITNEENIINDITNLIRNNSYYSEIKSNLSDFLYSNDAIIAKIINILN